MTELQSSSIKSEYSEAEVLELAKEMGEARIKSHEAYKKLKQAAEENPKASLENIVDESRRIVDLKTYKIILYGM